MRNSADRRIQTYGRKGGRPLSKRQKQLLADNLPGLEIPLTGARTLDPESLFQEADAIWLEIGFGGGEHVIGQAKANPNIGILASEVFIEGVAKCLVGIEDNHLQNVRLWPEDARVLMDALGNECVDRAFILFPDPWPKRRQNKRRLIQTEFLDALARVMRPGGQVRFATDVRSYADEALLRFLQHDSFHWPAETGTDWRDAPADHITTRYQTKQLGDIAPVYYDFART